MLDYVRFREGKSIGQWILNPQHAGPHVIENKNANKGSEGKDVLCVRHMLFLQISVHRGHAMDLIFV